MDNLYLLIKYYQKQANTSEKELVEDWLSESEENRTQYQQQIQVWKASEKVKILENVDLESDWKLISKRAKVKPPSVHNVYSLFLRIAAALILIFASYWFLHNKFTEEKYVQVQNMNKNQVRVVTLADGSRISLNYLANLHYLEHFGAKSRKVKLEGSAFFEVAKNKEKPFTIETKLSEVRVLGTSFDVQAEQTQTVVTVATGKVRVTDKIDENEFVDLLPNEQAIHKGKEMQKHVVEIGNYLSWKTGVFSFSNHSLAEAMEILKKRFHFEYHFEKDDLMTREITADFGNEPLSNIIEIIQLSCQVKINFKSNRLIISENE